MVFACIGAVRRIPRPMDFACGAPEFIGYFFISLSFWILYRSLMHDHITPIYILPATYELLFGRHLLP